MNLHLVKPDLYYFDSYNAMMREWIESGTQIAPWFLGEPFDTLQSFAEFIRMLDNCEHGNLDPQYSSTTSYFALDERDQLIGATSLRHYLTLDGYRSWGHIGYGVQPSARRKGYATRMLEMTLEEAKHKHIHKVLIGCHTSNIGSACVIEACNGKLENVVPDPNCNQETISRYWIDNL